MAYTINNATAEKMLPQLVALTPYNVYINQVKSAIEPIRKLREGLDYFPPQLGGISGQRTVISEVVVLEMIDFEFK